MSEQLTDWFPASVKPLRPGVYEVSGGGGGNFSEWNGKAWGLRTSKLHLANDWTYEGRFVKTSIPPQKWRGLAADPHSRTDDSQTDDHTGICEVTE